MDHPDSRMVEGRPQDVLAVRLGVHPAFHDDFKVVEPVLVACRATRGSDWKSFGANG